MICSNTGILLSPHPKLRIKFPPVAHYHLRLKKYVYKLPSQQSQPTSKILLAGEKIWKESKGIHQVKNLLSFLQSIANAIPFAALCSSVMGYVSPQDHRFNGSHLTFTNSCWYSLSLCVDLWMEARAALSVQKEG